MKRTTNGELTSKEFRAKMARKAIEREGITPATNRRTPSGRLLARRVHVSKEWVDKKNAQIQREYPNILGLTDEGMARFIAVQLRRTHRKCYWSEDGLEFIVEFS